MAGCSTNLVCIFDISSSTILQSISVAALSIALIGDTIITGDVEGTLVCWQLKNAHDQSSIKRTLSRQSTLPMPAPKVPVRRDTCPPSSFGDLNVSKVSRRRTAWAASLTPFKVNSFDEQLFLC